MITEDYVSFEIAKLLKEKGFDSNIYTCYTDCEFPEFLTMIDYVIQGEEYERSNFESHNLIQAPTHQTALKWLREVHNIFIDIMTYTTGSKIQFRWVGYQKGRLFCEDNKEAVYYDSHEECEQAALKYTLENLI